MKYNEPEVKKTILEIFKNDKKTRTYLERRLDLNDDDFIDAAVSKRPSNRKLKEFLDTRKEEIKADDVKKILEVSTSSEFDFVLSNVLEIFKNDKNTYSRILSFVETDKTYQELLDYVTKLRPKSAKLRIFKNNLDSIFKSNKDLNVTYDDVQQEVIVEKEKNVSTLSDIEILSKLKDIFKNDIGTFKMINKHEAGDLSAREIVKLTVKRRPSNRKLRDLVMLLNDIDDAIIENKTIDTVKKEVKNCKPIPFIKNGNRNITLYLDGVMTAINFDHPNFDDIKVAIDQEQWCKIKPLVSLKKQIQIAMNGKIKLTETGIFLEEKELSGAVIDFIVEYANKNADNISLSAFLKFLEKLLLNPSERAKKELFGFLKAGNIPIAENGNILTYKKITENYLDCYTKTIDNSIGSIVKMNREDVDPNSSVTCSNGLHVCSYSYLRHFGGERTVICEVNPRDVVSIPDDYNAAKMRCCQYKVIDEIENNGADVLKDNGIYFKI